jgi:hemerythrin-like metal-binding protein
MARAGYPDLEAHRKHHLDLISQLNSREALLQLEQSEQSAEQVIDFLVSWFVNHTTGEDRLFADFYHRQQNR